MMLGMKEEEHKDTTGLTLLDEWRYYTLTLINTININASLGDKAYFISHLMSKVVW